MWWGLQLQNPDVRCNWQPRTKFFLISFDHLESLSSHFQSPSSHFQSPSSHFQSFSNHFQSFRVNHSNFINLDTSKFINSSSAFVHLSRNGASPSTPRCGIYFCSSSSTTYHIATWSLASEGRSPILPFSSRTSSGRRDEQVLEPNTRIVAREADAYSW